MITSPVPLIIHIFFWEKTMRILSARIMLFVSAVLVWSWLSGMNGECQVQWSGKWIWLENSGPQLNMLAEARKEFVCKKTDPVLVRISADSRYRLYINDKWAGDGPSRSFPNRQQFDTYDVASYINDGTNVIGVEILHWGESTFQYLSGKPGFLCQVEIGKAVIPSDGAWKMRVHPGHQRQTQRIACQQGFEEQLDGRGANPDWLRVGYDDSGWKNAIELGPVGTPPWTVLEERAIPFLTREIMYPTGAVSIKQVKAPDYVSGVNTRYSLGDSNLTANYLPLSGSLLTIIHSPTDQIMIARPANTTGYNLSVNGKNYGGFPRWQEQPIELKTGINLLVAELPPQTHWSAATFSFNFEKPVKIQAPVGETEWAAAKYDRHNKQLSDAVRNVTTWETLTSISGVQIFPVSKEHISPAVAYNSVWAGKETGKPSNVKNIQNAFSNNPDVAEIDPAEGDTEIVLDFGKEVIGYFDMVLEASEGVVVDVACYEAIEDGKIHWSEGNLCSFRYTTRAGLQEFLSRYRRGFRYASMVFRNVTQPVKISDIRLVLATYPDDRKGTFNCSDPVLNKIWETGAWTLRMCSEDTFTDCPLYEQTYWVGDGRNEALVSYPVWGPTPLVKRCSLLPGQSLYRSQLTESQVPSGWQNIIPAWSFLWVQMADEYYLYSADKETLEKNYPDVVKLLDHCKTLCTDKGLFSIDAWNFFDWAGMDTGNKTCTHNNILLAETANRAAKMATYLGKAEDAAKWNAFRKELIDKINQNTWNPQTGLYVDSIHADGNISSVTSQQTNALALLYGVTPDDKKADLLNKVITPPQGMVTAGSPFSLFYVLELLSKEQKYDEIVKVIRDRWKPMLDKGATTFWEMLPSPGSQWWTRSHCHAWSAAPTYFLSSIILGVKPLEPGFKKFVIAPKPVDLEWCEGQFPTAHGVSKISWKKTATSFMIKASIPEGTDADIVFPFLTSDLPKITVNGKDMQGGLPEGIRIIHDPSKLIMFGAAGGREVTIEASK